MGNLTQAILHAGTAVAIAPDIAIPYLHLAKIYLKMGNWTEVEHYAQRVIQLGVPQITAPINEMDYIITPRQMLIEVEVRKGNLERAKEMMLELRKVAPGFDIRDEIRSIDLSITDNKAVKAYVDILRYLRVYNMTDTLDLFVKSIPKSLRNNSFLRNVIKEAKRDYKRKHEPVQIGSPMTIVLFAGNHFEHWDGHSDRKQGIGGSEGMTIQLMREIAKLGNKVTIYGNPEEEGMFDGVEYLNWQKWDAGIKCDIFICLRQPALFKERIIKAKKQYSWVHDTGYGDIAADVFYIPNKVTALSESHKEVLMKEHGIKDESIFWMTRNALNARSLKYAKKNAGERNKFQMIYASSYDRGLINALNMWPKIKEAVPEATLKIFYGWNTYDAMMNMRLQQGDPYGQHMHQLKQEIMEKITLLDGVYEYGRVSQDELYKEFAESDVWFYPTEFYEISCITAMQAQALGAVPVCTPVAALRETVNEEYGFKMNLDKIADGLIYLLQNHNELEGRREPMMKWATKAYDVKSLAKEWVEEFSS
jgi:glycosyltransferase involved in cell wall biosynthesis